MPRTTSIPAPCPPVPAGSAAGWLDPCRASPTRGDGHAAGKAQGRTCRLGEEPFSLGIESVGEDGRAEGGSPAVRDAGEEEFVLQLPRGRRA